MEIKIVKIASISLNQKIYNPGNIQFKACFSKPVDHSAKWSWKKLRILERSDKEMIDMAEFFHKKDDWELRQIAEGNSFLVSEDKIQKAYKKLKSAIDKVLRKKSQIEEKINNGNNDDFTIRMLKSELDRLNDKAENVQLIEKLYKKSF